MSDKPTIEAEPHARTLPLDLRAFWLGRPAPPLDSRGEASESSSPIVLRLGSPPFWRANYSLTHWIAASQQQAARRARQWLARAGIDVHANVRGR